MTSQDAREGALNAMDLGPFAHRLTDHTLCTNCGECCHFGVDLGGEAIATLHDLPCRHLERDEEHDCYRCRVYPTRLDPAGPAPWCRSTYDCVREGLFPPTCPYVAGIPGYRGRISFKLDHQRKLLEPLLHGPRPEGIDDLAWERARGRPTQHQDTHQLAALLGAEEALPAAAAVPR